MTLPKINFWLFGVLVFVVLLRLPSFFEPHWYGDEEIYLVLGQMMRRGAVLYRDIWDNKTPLIYFLYALSPTLLWAKLSATGFVLATTLGVYKFSQKLFADKSSVYILFSTALAGILLSLPVLEGNIANAELYFTLPIVLGAILVYRILITDYKLTILVWIGFFAATAFLFKVPAAFDFVGLLLAYSLIKLVDEFWSPARSYKRFFVNQFRVYLPIAASMFIPILLAGLYFLLNHALQDFVIAAFSQNASYVAIDSGPFSKLSNPLFVKGVLLVLGVIAMGLAYFRKLVSKEFVLLSLWFGFSFYGALLSNRPYPHYLLQIVPPLVILVMYILANFRRYVLCLLILVLILYWPIKTFAGQFYFIKDLFSQSEVPYYSNFLDYVSERKSWEDYVSYFDRRTLDDYAVANFIAANTYQNDPVFVWGDVASIYTVSERPAATKFIQAHHLTTIDSRNYDLILQRLLKYQPKYIVVTRPVQFKFLGLELLIQRNYQLLKIVGPIYIYQNIAPFTPPGWNPKYN